MSIGKRETQLSFSDNWLIDRIPNDSYWHKLRTWVLENIDEKDFEPLFSQYGRPSVSPVYTLSALLVQLEKGYSDRELEGETRFDDRVKYAITANRDFEGIDAVTLHDHRKRFFENEVGLTILAKTLMNAKDEGIFSKDNLHVIDSFMIWGAAAKQDTYTLIYKGIKLVLKIAGFHELQEKAKGVLIRDDYDKDQNKPKINWQDKKQKNQLLNELVTDALGLVKHFRKQDSLPNDLAEVCNLLERVATQDVNIDDDGNVQMINGTAKDRVISLSDPEMRHGRKCTSKKNDGYKAEILTGGPNGSLVVGVQTAPANTPDGKFLSDLIDQAQENDIDIDKIYGDSAYTDWDEIDKRKKDDNIKFYTKVCSSINRYGLYTKDDFKIDIEKAEVTCPAGNTKDFNKEKLSKRKKQIVKFPTEKCKNCPLKGNCTTSKTGRSIAIHSYEDKIQEQLKLQQTTDYKEEYSKRANGERTIAHLTRHGARKARFFGNAKIKFQIILAAVNQNIKQIMRLKSKPQPI